MDSKYTGKCAQLIAGTAGLTCALTVGFGAQVTIDELKGVYGTDLQILGSVQKIDVGSNVLIVAGQQVSIGKDTLVSYNGLSVTDRNASLNMIQVGDMLAVHGSLDEPAEAIQRLSTSYVPGATLIFVSGRVMSVKASVGVAKVGGLTVDFTPAMAAAKFTSVESGEVIEALGTQPVAGGALIAESIERVNAANNDSIIGTASIIGSASATKPSSIIGTASIIGSASA
jgi:hypothetical protein